MKKLTEEETKQIIGGYKKGIFFTAAAFITFLIGLVDGYIRPLKCNN